MPSSRHSHRRASRRADMSDLVAQIDSYLADQLEQSADFRPSSAGTMFVDFDQQGDMQVSYRNRSDDIAVPSTTAPSTTVPNRTRSTRSSRQQPSDSSRTARSSRRFPSASFRSTAPTTTTSSTRRHPSISSSGTTTSTAPTTASLSTSSLHPAVQHDLPQDDIHIHPVSTGRYPHGMYISGYDPTTRFEYDYDGNIMHLHREGSRASSRHSEYYTLDAERYSPLRPLVEQDDGHFLHEKERKKRHRALSFVKQVLKKMEGAGIMKRFREERVRGRQEAKARTGRATCGSVGPVPQIPAFWRDNAYA